MPWEETPNEIRHRLRDPDDFRADTFRYKEIQGGAKAINLVLGKLKPENVPKDGDANAMVSQSVRFKKKTPDNPDGWVMSECKVWMESHKDLKDNSDTQLLQLPIDLTLRLSSIDSQFALMPKTSATGDILVEGWFVTEKPILKHIGYPPMDLIVRASAFKQPDSMSRFNGRILAFHDDDSGPIGEVTGMSIQEGRGIWGQVKLWQENAPLFKRAILSKTLNAFSIGFTITKYEVDEDKQTLTTTSAQLNEVSVVNIGADPNALFDIKNSLKSVNPIEVRSTQLPDKNPVDLDAFMTEHVELGAKVTDLTTMLNAIKETQLQFSKNHITKAELAERLESLGTSLSTLKIEMETAKNQRVVDSQKLAFTDFRGMLKIPWLTDENGNKVSAIEQAAHCLFQLPVDYTQMVDGYKLKNLRDLHDAVLISDAMLRYKGRDRHDIRNLSLFKQLVEATKEFDPNVALAMAGGNVGYGAEWLPEEMSAEFSEILRVQPMLASKFITWLMPRGGSAKYPFQNGRAVVYKGGEALVDNAEEARKTNIATGVKTFTPELFIGALVASEELTEDTILDMVAFVRKELAVAQLEGLETALINGDDSVTHFDNANGTTSYQSYQVETAFKGLRKLAISNTVQAADTVNGLVLSDFVAVKQLMATAGLVPNDCIYVTGIKGKAAVQAALFAEDALGVLAFMLSGTVPNIDGSEVYISGGYNEALHSTGIADVTGTKYTSMVCAHKPSFRIGQRRGVTLEFNKNILTQQQQFVCTARYDFGKVCADAIVPTAAVIRMKHTA
jgi:HK97 family phage prohead protease